MKQHEILPYYDEHRFHSGWAHLAALRAFLPELFAVRELEGCHYFTSHAVLCLSRFSTYQERHGKPLLSIYATSPDMLQFEFITFEEHLQCIGLFRSVLFVGLRSGFNTSTRYTGSSSKHMTNRPEAPNHALQRTALGGDSLPRSSRLPRPEPSLSLGSLALTRPQYAIDPRKFAF